MATKQIITVFDGLEQDWRRMERNGELDRALACWREEDDRFRQFDTVGDIVDLLADRKEPPERQSQVLLALLGVGRRDALALRLVLHRFLPSPKRIAAWAQPFRQTDWNARVLSAAYEVLATYPVERRTQRVMANIVWDIRNLIALTRVAGFSR